MTTAGVQPRLFSSAATRDVAASLVAGQLAGVAMLLAMVLVSAARGDPGMPPRAIASIALGDAALRGDASVAVFGVLLHQGVFTVIWSVVFAALARHASRRHPFSLTAIGMGDRWGVVALGPLVGMMSQLVDVIFVMPAFLPEAEWTELFSGLWGWLYHFVFGVGLSTFPLVRRWLFPGVPPAEGERRQV